MWIPTNGLYNVIYIVNSFLENTSRVKDAIVSYRTGVITGRSHSPSYLHYHIRIHLGFVSQFSHLPFLLESHCSLCNSLPTPLVPSCTLGRGKPAHWKKSVTLVSPVDTAKYADLIFVDHNRTTVSLIQGAETNLIKGPWILAMSEIRSWIITSALTLGPVAPEPAWWIIEAISSVQRLRIPVCGSRSRAFM